MLIEINGAMSSFLFSMDVTYAYHLFVSVCVLEVIVSLFVRVKWACVYKISRLRFCSLLEVGAVSSRSYNFNLIQPEVSRALALFFINTYIFNSKVLPREKNQIWKRLRSSTSSQKRVWAKNSNIIYLKYRNDFRCWTMLLENRQFLNIYYEKNKKTVIGNMLLNQ